MSIDDQTLKINICRDVAPALPASFADDTLKRIAGFQSIKANPHSGQEILSFDGFQKYKWWAMGLALSAALAAQLSSHLLLEDDLLHVDTLAMSSLSVL